MALYSEVGFGVVAGDDYGIFLRDGAGTTTSLLSGAELPLGSIPLFVGAVNSHGDVLFRTSAPWAQSLYAAADGQISLLAGYYPVGFDINDSRQVVWTDSAYSLWMVQDTVPAPVPPLHNEVLFVSGIGSHDDCGANPDDAHSQTNETKWMRDYLTQTPWVNMITGLQPADFTVYDYTSGTDWFQSCGSSGHSASYASPVSCYTLDNAYSDPSGVHNVVGQAARLAAYIHLLPANTRVTLITHSQGGVLATYAVHDFLEDPLDLAKVKGIVTLDSPLGGIPAGSADLLAFIHGCNEYSQDSSSDMLPDSTVVNRIHTLGSEKPKTRLFTVNETGDDHLCVPYIFNVLCTDIEVIDSDHSQIQGWQDSHLEVTTGNHETVWNDGPGTNFVANDVERKYIGCAVAGLTPPSACEAFATGADINVSANQATFQELPVGSGSPKLTTLTVWPGSTVTTTLVSPSGRVIDASTTDADVVHQGTGTSELFTIQAPEAGTWQIKLFGLDVPAGTEPVTLGTFVEPVCPIMRADVDGDGAVSILDLTRVAQYFTQSVPPAPARYDQDGDNLISILDLTQMAQVFTTARQRVSVAGARGTGLKTCPYVSCPLVELSVRELSVR